MAEDLLGYEQLTQEAMRGVVRAALQRAAGPKGLPAPHHFYITFRTTAPGVTIPAQMLARYPEEMTIVLEHQYWDLEVFPDHFRVILKFSGSPSHVVVPYSALTRFYDPSVRFGLQFEPLGGEAPKSEPEAEAPAPEPAREAAGGGASAPSVISLDAFRKK